MSRPPSRRTQFPQPGPPVLTLQTEPLLSGTLRISCGSMHRAFAGFLKGLSHNLQNGHPWAPPCFLWFLWMPAGLLYLEFIVPCAHTCVIRVCFYLVCSGEQLVGREGPSEAPEPPTFPGAVIGVNIPFPSSDQKGWGEGLVSSSSGTDSWERGGAEGSPQTRLGGRGAVSRGRKRRSPRSKSGSRRKVPVGSPVPMPRARERPQSVRPGVWAHSCVLLLQIFIDYLLRDQERICH